MPTFQADYLRAYHNLKLTRDGKGVLVAEFHSNGGPFIMSAQAHTELVEAFYRISQDRENKIVILTGAGGSSLLMSSGPPSAMSPIPAFGARFTTKAFRCWKISPTYASQSSRLSKDAPTCIQTMRYLPA